MTQSGFDDYRDDFTNALGLVRNIRAGTAHDSWQASFCPAAGDLGEAPRLRVTMLAPMDGSAVEVMLAEIPSIRRALEANTDRLKYWMPMIIARRTGENLESEFLAVHEPYVGQPVIRDINRKDAALVVRTEAFTDVHLFGEIDGPYVCDGRYGFLRIRQGEVVHGYLADGSSLAHAGCQIQLPPPAQGKVVSVDGRKLILSGSFSAEHADRVYLAFPNGAVYAIRFKEIQAVGRNTRMILEESPCFVLNEKGDGGRFTAYPQTAFDGRYATAYRVLAPIRPKVCTARPLDHTDPAIPLTTTRSAICNAASNHLVGSLRDAGSPAGVKEAGRVDDDLFLVSRGCTDNRWNECRGQIIICSTDRPCGWTTTRL
jgi:hypothetical protein